jgi:hypothetical protein
VSTILKALQRLEDEKSANSERSLSEQVVARRPPPDPERRGLKIGAVAIGGLAVAAAAFFFWPAQEEPIAEVAIESPPSATAPATKTEVAVEKPRRRRTARPAPAARPQQDSSEVEISSVVEVVQHLDALSAVSRLPVEPPESATPPAKAGDRRPARQPSASKSDRQTGPGSARPRSARPRSAQTQVADAKPPATQIVGSSVLAKPAAPPPAPVKIAAVAPKPAPPAPAEIAAVAPKPAPPAQAEIAAAAPKPAPAAAPAPIAAAIREPERKAVYRAKLPALSIERTIWHPDAERRVAVVKLIDADEVLRLREGDAVGPLVVKVINPDNVLFDHDDIEIRYNVGS